MKGEGMADEDDHEVTEVERNLTIANDGDCKILRRSKSREQGDLVTVNYNYDMAILYIKFI